MGERNRIQWEHDELAKKQKAMDDKEREEAERRRIALEEEAERLRKLEEERKRKQDEIQAEKERLREQEDEMRRKNEEIEGGGEEKKENVEGTGGVRKRETKIG